jgi:hypothetical protein
MSRQLSANEYSPITTHGPKAEYVPKQLLADLAAIVNIAHGGNFTTNVYSADGFYDFVLGLTASQTGSLIMQRYIDDAATVALDAGQSLSLSAATAGVLTVTDGKPFATFTVEITNTNGSLSTTLSSIAALMSSH